MHKALSTIPNLAKYLFQSLSLLLVLAATSFAQQGAIDGDWQAYGADNGSTKYTGLSQIDRTNVQDLQLAWRRPALDSYYTELNAQQRYTTNWVAAPIIKNGVGYIPNGVGLIEAFDPSTGETVWAQEPPGGVEGLPGATTRGAAYWSDGSRARIFVQRGTFLYALDANSGQALMDFGENGRVDLQLMPEEFERFRWGGVPMVVGDVDRKSVV